MHAGDVFIVIRACAVDTHDGEVESEGYERPAQLERHQIYAHGVFIPGPPQIWCEMRYAVGCVTP